MKNHYFQVVPSAAGDRWYYLGSFETTAHIWADKVEELRAKHKQGQIVVIHGPMVKYPPDKSRRKRKKNGNKKIQRP